jgi:hypothetical protein
MPLNYLLWNCLVRNKTSVGERGLAASMERRPNECVLAFEIDDEGFRRQFGLAGQMGCDAMFFFWRPGGDPQVLLVELKSKDVAKATKQLASSLSALRTAFNKLTLRPRYHAVVVKAGRVPPKIKELKATFENQYRVGLTVTADRDMRKVLSLS